MRILSTLRKLIIEQNEPQKSKFRVLYDKYVGGDQGENFLIDKDKGNAFYTFLKTVVGDRTSEVENVDVDSVAHEYRSATNKEDFIQQLDSQIKKVGNYVESTLKKYDVQKSKFRVLYDKHVEGNQGDKFVLDKDKNKAFNAFLRIVVGDPTSEVVENADVDFAVSKYKETSLKEDFIRQLDPQIKKVGNYVEWLLKNYKQPGLPKELSELDKKSPQFAEEFQRIFNYPPSDYREFFLENLPAIAQNLKQYFNYKKYLPAELKTPEKKDDNGKSVKNPEYKGDINFVLNIAELTTIVDEKINPNIPERVKEKELKKAVRSSTKGIEVPGSEIIYNGSNWVLIKISNENGLDAARYFGGFHDVNKGETSWCTSPRGYNQYFMKYIKQSPLYVVIPGWVNDLSDLYWDQFSDKNNSPENEKKKIIEEELSKIGKSYGDVGQLTGLPSNRFQLHCPPNISGEYTVVQFKDRRDGDIPLFNYLSGEGLNWSELREPLRIPLAMRFAGGTSSLNTDSFELNYTGSKSLTDSVGYLMSYSRVYGFDVILESLGETNSITSFIVTNTTNDKFTGVDFDQLIARMPNLELLTLDNVIDKLPKNIYGLNNLEYLNLTRNSLVNEEFSTEIGNMDNLSIINLKGSPKIKFPNELNDVFTSSSKNPYVYFKI